MAALDEFIKKYYKQLHFNSMSPEAHAQYADWLKKGQLTRDMQLWARDYLEHDASGKPIPDGLGGYQTKELPDPGTLDDDVLLEMFSAFQAALIGMASAKGTFKDKNQAAVDFLDEYFGPNAMFNIAPATSTTEAAIVPMMELLIGRPDPSDPNRRIGGDPDILDYVIKHTLDAEGKPVFGTKTDWNDFVKKVEDKKYNSDHKVQTKLQQVAQTLSDVIGWSSSIQPGTPQYNKIENISRGLKDIMADDAFSAPVDPASWQFQAFKNGEAAHLLKRIYEDESVYSVFSKYDNQKFSKHVDKAQKDIPWQDAQSPNYVPPKSADKLTLGQQIKKWWSDTYSDTFKKYEELRGATNLFHQESKDIFAAIDKVGIKPKDGLTGLLGKAEDVKKKLRSPVAKEHFEWFTKTLGDIKNSMPKAFEGAWKNGQQMRAVVDRIMIAAVTDSKDPEGAMRKAETAMEIMVAMKYGMLTSKTLDALRKEPISIFSDKDLSWNKNEGMKFVTKAFDESIKAAFVGVGAVITIVGNRIRLSGRKYKKSHNQDPKSLLGKYYQAEQDRVNGVRDRFIDNKTRQRDAIDQKIIDEQSDLTALGPGYTSATIDARRTDRDAQQVIKNNNQAVHDQFEANKRIEAEYQNTLRNRGDVKRKLRNVKGKIAANNATLAAGGLSYSEQTRIQKETDALVDQETQLQEQLDQANQNLRAGAADYATARRYIQDPANINAHANYENAATAYDDISSKIKQFEDGTKAIKELKKTRDAVNTAITNGPPENYNRLLKLERFWNFLNSGDNHTYALSHKWSQARYDANKEQLLAKYIASHDL